MNHMQNPLDNRHDLIETLWYTKLNSMASLYGFDIDKFLMTFMLKGRRREKIKRVNILRKNITDPSVKALETDLRDVMCSQLRHEIYRSKYNK